MNGNLTEHGMNRLKLAEAFDLEAFYDPHMGNICIVAEDMTPEVMNNVLRFLQANTDWVMGCEEYDTGCYYTYITTLEDLTNTI